MVAVVFAFCWLPLYAVNVRLFFGEPLDVDDRPTEFQLLTQTVIPVAQWVHGDIPVMEPVMSNETSPSRPKIETRLC